MPLDPQFAHKRQMKNWTPLLRRKPDEDFFAWQEKGLEKLKEILGYPFEKAADDAFVIEWENKDDPRFDETRFLFQSEEDVTVNAHLLLPKGAKGKVPLVICMQGHTTGAHISMGRKVHEIDDQFLNDHSDFAIQAVSRGYAALAMDQRGFGERGGVPNSYNDHDLSLQALMMGRSLVGERCFDVSCAIDIIEKYFPMIDAERIAMMGVSGGATTTFFLTPLEPRIKASMPGCVYTGLFDCYGDMHHCVCCYIPGMFKYFDMGEIAALAAPRPQVIVNGEKDPTFPISGTPAQWAITQKAYQDAGAADNVRLVIGPEGHRFYPDLAWPVFDELLNWKEK